MSEKILLSKWMYNHVTICRVFRRGVLCLACLLASQVVADFSDLDSIQLQNISDATTSSSLSDDQLLRILGAYNQTVTLPQYRDDFSYNPFYKMSNTSMIHALNIIKQQMASPTYQNRVGNDYYATLYGLIAGWTPNSVPNVDGIPYGVETNGIFWYARDLSDSLHNTNSVFHRQLTAQETLTNQMERFLAHTSNYLERISYQLSYPYANSIESYFMHQGEFNTSPLTNSIALLGLPAFNGLDLTLLDWDLLYDELYQYPWAAFMEDLLYLEFQSDYRDYSNMRYQRYGTKWGFDSITNILLSQDFDFNSISTVKPEVDDMIQDSIEEVQDSLPSSDESQEDVIPPGDYEEIQDERIDTSFLEEAKTDTTSIKFSEHLFDDFKSSYNGIFNFRSSSSLQYSFSLQSSDGVNVSVNDTDMLGNASQLLSEKKPTIDALIKIIIGLNKFICLVVLVGKSFKMVSEIFSS